MESQVLGTLIPLGFYIIHLKKIKSVLADSHF